MEENGKEEMTVASHILSRDSDPHFVLWRKLCFRGGYTSSPLSRSIGAVVRSLAMAGAAAVVLPTLLVPRGSTDALRYSAWVFVFVVFFLGRLLWLGRSMTQDHGSRHWFTRVRLWYNSCYEPHRTSGRCMYTVMPTVKVLVLMAGLGCMAAAAVLVATTADFDADAAEGGSQNTRTAALLGMVTLLAGALCCLLPVRSWSWVTRCVRRMRVHVQMPTVRTESATPETDVLRLEAARHDVKAMVCCTAITLTVVCPFAWSFCEGDGCGHAPQLSLFVAGLILAIMAWRLFNLMHPQRVLVWTKASHSVMKSGFYLLEVIVVLLFGFAGIIFALGSLIHEPATSSGPLGGIDAAQATPTAFGYEVRE